MNKTSPSPTTNDGTFYELKYHLSVEDRTSFFQDQFDHCLSGARTGCHTNLNLVSKSGNVVTAHQAVLLPLSSHLKSLVESSNSCGCIEDVPTLLLPDWDHKVMEALLILIYSGSVTVTHDVMEDILNLMNELRFDISRDQLLTTAVVLLPVSTTNKSVEGKNPIEEAMVAENQMSTDSSSTSENPSAYKIGWIPSIKIENIETEEQENVMKKLSELLVFLKCVHVKNKESFVMIMKPFDDLLSSWKYLPTEPSFDCFPIEIKRHILSKLCKSGAFVAASVCREWKTILKNRLIMMREVTIGKHCSNILSCEDGECFMPEELLKASIAVKLDVRLRICHPIMNVDPSLLAEALCNVSGFSITTECSCGGNKDIIKGKQMMTQNQIEVLFENLEQKKVRLLSLELTGLDLNNLNQDRLFNCLFKAKRLLLGSSFLFKPDLDEYGFIEKLLQTNRNGFSHLYLERLEYPCYSDISCNDLANGLCRIKTVFLGTLFSSKPLEHLIQYILTHPIRTKNLFIQAEVNWRDLITTEELKALLNKLNRFAFLGNFNLEQVEAAWDIPGVYVEQSTVLEYLQLITKGIYLDINQVYCGISLDRFSRNLQYWFV